jgi:hypothetical protein
VSIICSVLPICFWCILCRRPRSLLLSTSQQFHRPYFDSLIIYLTYVQGRELLLPTDIVHAPEAALVNTPFITPHSPDQPHTEGSSPSRHHWAPIDALDTATCSISNSTDIDWASPVHICEPCSNLHKGQVAADIGPETRRRFSEALKGCKTILWSGPMGCYEDSCFAGGTESLARAIVRETNAGAISIVGGTSFSITYYVLVTHTLCSILTRSNRDLKK